MHYSLIVQKDFSVVIALCIFGAWNHLDVVACSCNQFGDEESVHADFRTQFLALVNGIPITTQVLRKRAVWTDSCAQQATLMLPKVNFFQLFLSCHD